MEGIFKEESLAAIHRRFSPQYITAGCEDKVAHALAELPGELARLGIAVSPEALAANFMRLPLYAAILSPDQIPEY